MREIKFRIMTDYEEWCYYVIPDDFNNWESNASLFYDKEETLGEYTGLKDKNKKEIYEGDIIYRKYYYSDDGVGNRIGVETIAKVMWGDCKFYVEPLDDMWVEDWNLVDDADRLEVIGNIYKNPELLK